MDSTTAPAASAWLGVVCEFSGQFCWIISNMLKNIQYADFLSGFVIERRTGKKIVVGQSLHKNYQAKVCNYRVSKMDWGHFKELLWLRFWLVPGIFPYHFYGGNFFYHFFKGDLPENLKNEPNHWL